MGACTPRHSWKFFQSIQFLLYWIFMYFVQSNIQHVSTASGGKAPRPPLGLCPGPHWGTSVPRPPLLSTRRKFLAMPLLFRINIYYIPAMYNHHHHIYFPRITQNVINHKYINTMGRLPEKHKTHWLAACVIIECSVELIWKGKQRTEAS